MRPALGCVALVASFAVFPACTHTASSGRPMPSSSVITYEELARHRFTDVYDAVQALHSNWLITRGTDSFMTPSQVVVIMDDTHLGGVDALHTINIKSVVYIQYYNGIDATGRWGLDHGSGVIFVSTRNAPGSQKTPPDTTGA